MPPHPRPRGAREAAEGVRGLSRPTPGELIAVIAEVEPLRRTLERFPGLTRDELVAILKRSAEGLESTVDSRQSTVPDFPTKPTPVKASSSRTSGDAQLGLSLPERAARARDAARALAEGRAPSARAGQPAAEPSSKKAPLVEVAEVAEERDEPTERGEIFSVWSDGASRGNPGPASLGVIIRDAEGAVVREIGERLGTKTNNFAEYSAVRRALLAGLELGASGLVLHADSELVIRQLRGEYKVKNVDLKPLYDEVKGLERRFPRGVKYQHVPREKNKDADRLANLALDTP